MSQLAGFSARMEALGILGVVTATARVTSTVWSLGESWLDAPRDFHRLKDELRRVQLFFDETNQAMNSLEFAQASEIRTPRDDGLSCLLLEGATILERLEGVINDLKGESGRGDQEELRKRRRLKWMANAQKLSRLRCELGGVTSAICQLLIIRSV